MGELLEKKHFILISALLSVLFVTLASIVSYVGWIKFQYAMLIQLILYAVYLIIKVHLEL